MAPSIGLNLRVTGYCNQGGRKYMEDVFSVAYQQTEDEKDLEYAFFGIFDGHGGREAALFAKEHLMDFIVRQKSFWGDDDESVLRAIHDGFLQTHQAMWKELETWPKTASGLPSTAGTTASIAFIRRSKIYIGHVGDSAIVLGVQDPDNPDFWRCEPLTRDHKPESIEESKRIEQSGGKVICKSGVPRVVWNRPKMGHKGPIRRSTPIDEIPFLAVARSLGDLWSYNSEEDVFVVSPEPDTYVYPIDILKHRCLILGTDGAWNMISPQQAVSHVCLAEKANEQHMLNPTVGRQWINPSKRLVDKAIEKWNVNNLRADNTSVVTVMLDPPGPPRAQVLKRQRELAQLNNTDSNLADTANSDRGSVALVTNTTPLDDTTMSSHPPPPPPLSSSSSSSPLPPSSPKIPPSTTTTKPQGISIVSRFSNSRSRAESLRLASVPTSTDESVDESPPVNLSDSKGAIQCNEVSSSNNEDDDDGRPRPRPLSLSRELSALKLDNPVGFRMCRSRTRSRSESTSSDAENEEHPINRTLRSSRKRKASSEKIILQRCSGKFHEEQGQSVKKVLQSSNQHYLRSTKQAMTLRSSRKRKNEEDKFLLSRASKSPKSSKHKVLTKQPVILTRSRTARVLRLKK